MLMRGGGGEEEEEEERKNVNKDLRRHDAEAKQATDPAAKCRHDVLMRSCRPLLLGTTDDDMSQLI
jgi:hypothetical protein